MQNNLFLSLAGYKVEARGNGTTARIISCLSMLGITRRQTLFLFLVFPHDVPLKKQCDLRANVGVDGAASGISADGYDERACVCGRWTPKTLHPYMPRCSFFQLSSFLSPA